MVGRETAVSRLQGPSIGTGDNRRAPFGDDRLDRQHQPFGQNVALPNTDAVHGDLHTANYLFERGHVGAIDFEDCGLGHYLYDLAVILDEVLARFPGREPTFRTALLQGYRAVRPLPAEHEALLDTFIAMRLAELIRWYGSAADPAVRAQAHTLIAEAMRHFARLEPAAW